MSGNVIVEGTSALEAQLGVLVEEAAGLDGAQLLGPSGLADWRVVDLLLHVAARAERLGRAASAEPPLVRQVTVAAGPPPTVVLARSVGPGLPDRAQLPVQDAAATVREAARRLSRRLARVEGDRLVTTRIGVMSLGEALLLHCLEDLHHAVALARAVGAEPTGLCHPETVAYAAAWTGTGSPTGVLRQLQRPQESAVPCVRWVGPMCPATCLVPASLPVGASATASAASGAPVRAGAAQLVG